MMQIAAMDVDKYLDLSAQFNFTGIPTILFFGSGRYDMLFYLKGVLTAVFKRSTNERVFWKS